MKLENVSSDVSKLNLFKTSLNSQYISEVPETLFSGISKNGLWMWIVHDTTINFYYTENSEWLGGYCFAESLKNPSAKITSAVEFCSSHISFPCLLICINQDHESIVCLFDIKALKVARAILVPDTVLQLEVISGNGGACMDTHHLYIQLRYMFGVVGLGTSSGHLYFLDLCLDEEFQCDENLPNITFMVIKYELTPERRERCLSKQQHAFILLNDQGSKNGLFEYEGRHSSLGHFPYGKVQVTALKYIQSTVTLALGFNFGGIQLWNLQDLCLLYSIANQSYEQAIVSFAFQEPENDPRNFCYLWVIRGHSAVDRPEDFSVATMYSLTYYKRTFVESFGNLYTDFQCCSKRFEYPLTSDPFSAAQSSSSIGSCILSCQIVCQTESHYLNASSANDSDTASENMSLCFLSWLVWSDAGNSPTSYHLALFDLNQWYQAQMPSFNFRSSPSELVSYLAHFSLEEAVQNFSDPILDLYAIPHSIKKFKFLTPSEEYFYPSSLDFQTILYSSAGICKVSFLGLQKKLLNEMADKSPYILINPKEFYLDLIKCGLVSDPQGNSDRLPLIVQREGLFQLALEYHIPVFFMKCLKEWKYSDSIQEGCTSRALLIWAWKKLSQIKSSIDKICLPFFNCSGMDVDKTSLKTLHSYRRQLDMIDSIFMGYQKFATPRTEQGMEEVKCRRDVTASLNMYLQVLLWLHLVHILPEVCEGEETDRNVFYSVSALMNAYLKRRLTLQKIHSSVGATDILLIDGFVKECFSENSWQKMGGNANYPPPSVYAALSCYFIDGVDLELKHSLMYYFLLDICSASHNLKNPFTSNVKNFPTVFWMSQSHERLIKAFWYLDQFNFEAAIKELLHPMVNASDILSWQHQRIIKSFLFQRESQKALRYINHMNPPESTIEDMKLRLSVFICRGAITQAFDYQRKKQTEGHGNELLHHLLLGCQETHRLKDVMYLPLNDFESSTLVKFLSDNKDPRAQEALVMYHLLRCNFFEAAKVNEKLSLSIPNKTQSTYERSAGRDALVESLLASVPLVEKNLVEEINRFPSFPIKKIEKPIPVPLSIKIAPLKQISYSDILNSFISNSSSATCATYLDSGTPVKSLTKSPFNNIPFLRPPLTPECTRLSTEAICNTPITKRALSSPISEFSSPSKKSRLLDNATFKSSSLLKKKIPKHLAGDVASLLQSPPIARRKANSAKENLNNSPRITPQGILKNKIEPVKFPASDAHTSKTPSVLSEAGDSSENEAVEGEKMVIDAEIHEDLPGRQIRFVVPPKEDLSISVLSSVSIESPVKEPTLTEKSTESSFMKRISQDINPISSMDSFKLRSNEARNISSLTRVPLKSHSSLLHERFPTSEQSKILCESVSQSKTPESTSRESSSYSVVESKITSTTEAYIDVYESDSSSKEESFHEIISPSMDPKSTELYASSTPTNVSTNRLASILTNSEEKEQSPSPILNKSGSSSGNSSYSSASERSLIITPRRPLRENSKNASVSDTSMMSAIEDLKDETLCIEIEKFDSATESYKTSSNQPIQEPIPTENFATEKDNLIISKPLPMTHTLEVKEAVIENVPCDESAIDSDLISVPTEPLVQGKKVDADIHTWDKIEPNIHTDKKIEADMHTQGSKIEADIHVQGSEIKADIHMQAKIEAEIHTHDSKIEADIHTQDSKIETDIYTQDSKIEANIHTQDHKIEADIHTQNEKVETEIHIEDANKEASEPVNIVSSGNVITSTESFQTIASESIQISNIDITPFTLATPNLPKYIPIKERISRAEKNTDVSHADSNASILSESATSKSGDNAAMTTHSVVTPRKGIHSDFQNIAGSSSCDAMDYDKSIAINTPEPLYANILSNKNTPKDLFGRLDYMSKNSEAYENSKIYKNAMKLLADDFSYDDYKLHMETKPARKTRSYVFKKTKSTKTAQKSESTTSGSKIHDEVSRKEFLDSGLPESYEQFSHSIQREGSAIGSTITLKSSPNADPEKSEQSQIKQRTWKKYDSSTALDRTPKSSIKKAKRRGKVTKKMEFSFAEPLSPASPEILEALATPADHPIGNFMFSPPLTRGRLRQKKVDESLGSSFASVISETSFVQQSKPPVDPILEGIINEKHTESKDLREVSKSKTKSSSKKKLTSSELRINKPQHEISNSSIDSSKLDTSNVSKSKISFSKQDAKHKMVLRQTKVKAKTQIL